MLLSMTDSPFFIKENPPLRDSPFSLLMLSDKFD